MRVTGGYKAALLTGVLGVGALLACVRGLGQQMAASFHVPTGSGTTVSVATLRVPEKAWKHFAKAKAAVERNRLAESDRETQKAIAIAPNFAEAYILRADSEVQEQSFEAAIADVKQARRVEPGVMWAGVILAGAYNGLHRYEEARLVLSGLHGSEAEAWQVSYEGARAAVGLEDTQRALYLSAVALNSAPDSFGDARLLRTNALILSRRWTDAQAQIEQYLQGKVPGNRLAHVQSVLANVKQRAREEDLQKLASR